MQKNSHKLVKVSIEYGILREEQTFYQLLARYIISGESKRNVSRGARAWNSHHSPINIIKVELFST